MNEDKKTENQNSFSAWALAWELGWQISIPLVFFALAGRFADNHFGTSPWLLVTGVVVAATASSFIIYRKVAKLLK